MRKRRGVIGLSFDQYYTRLVRVRRRGLEARIRVWVGGMYVIGTFWGARPFHRRGGYIQASPHQIWELRP